MSGLGTEDLLSKGSPDMLTTAEVPPPFLKPAYMVGHVPLRALAADPRVSYALYIPPAAYDPDPASRNSSRLPLLVHVHGTGRDLSALRTHLAAWADSVPCAVLAPLFPAALEGPHDLDSYQRLRCGTLQSDDCLLAMLAEVGRAWPGVDTARVFLAGFSGGGQFAHRFLYLHPERLAAVSIGAPGQVTPLDDARNWPAGVGDVEAVFGRAIRRDLVGQVAIQLVAGSDDNEVPGSAEFWDWVGEQQRQKGWQLPTMERGRLDSLRRLREGFDKESIDTRMDVVEGVRHVSGDVRERVLGFLRPLMEAKNSG